MKETEENMMLIRNILNGNRIAQETFYNEYKKIVKDYLKYKISRTNYSNEDIDDWVSDILIRIHYNLDKYDPEKSSIKTWVLTIAKHYLYDTYRGNSFKLTSNSLTLNTVDYSGSFFNTTTCDTNVPLYNMNTNISTSCNFENCNTINYISTQLSPSDFTLLNMKYVQGYDYNEIGKEFQITSSTVSNKINYIKTKLKKGMSEEIYD